MIWVNNLVPVDNRTHTSQIYTTMITARTRAVRMTSSMSYVALWGTKHGAQETRRVLQNFGDWCILPISSRVTPSADTGTIVKSQHLTWTCKINLCNAEFRQTWPFWEHLWISMLSWWSWWRHATERVSPSLTIWEATGFRIQRASNMEL